MACSVYIKLGDLFWHKGRCDCFRLFLGLRLIFSIIKSVFPLLLPHLLPEVIIIISTFPTLKISSPLFSPATGPFPVSFLRYPSTALFLPTAVTGLRERGYGKSVCSPFPSTAAALMQCLHLVFSE